MPRSPGGDDGRPEWWTENEQLREELGIPSYTPPRFADGVYTHTIVSPLETAHECTITLLSPDASGDWEVRVDGERISTVKRRRDENGNTVYDIESAEFRELVEAHLT